MTRDGVRYLTGGDMGAKCLFCHERRRAHGSQFCGPYCEQAHDLHKSSSSKAHIIPSLWRPSRTDQRKRERVLRGEHTRRRQRVSDVGTGMSKAAMRLAGLYEDVDAIAAELDTEL